MILLFLILSLTADERRRFEGGIALHLRSELEAAVREYDAVLDSSPDYVPARLYRAQAEWLSGRKDEAREGLRSTRESSSALLLHQLLAATFGETESHSPVVAKLLRAYPLEQNRFLATGTPSLVLLSMGDVAEAVSDYERAVLLDPEDVTLHRRLGTAFATARLWPPTVAAFERVSALDPTDVVAWRQLGSGNLVLQRWATAIAAFERALSLSRDEPAVLLALGYAHERAIAPERALELYRRAAALAPAWARPRYRIGRALLASGDLDGAEEAFEAAHALEPDFAEPLVFLGEVHLKRGETALAIEKLERALAIESELFEAHYHLALAYRRMGREEDARHSFARYEELKREQRDVASQEEVLARSRER